MGVALALLAMVSFASNILVTRYALTRMPLESGFLIVLSTNILFPAVLFGMELGARGGAFGWDWRGFALFAVSGVIGTFLGRRMLFDTVRLLGPARSSVFHSTAPAFAFLGAWLLAGERLGIYEVALVAIVWTGLWLTHPRVGSQMGGTRVTAELLRKGILFGLLAVAGFGFSNVIRGIAVRHWNEAVLGTVISSVAALALQLAVTRHWDRIVAQFRAASRGAIGLYVACGVATSLGSIFVTLAMTRIEIGLAVLVVHTTPLVIFPVSVFVLKHREELSVRTLAGTGLVLAGISALALR
jgi:drug/metabolite transporter (DMT)-like permease